MIWLSAVSCAFSFASAPMQDGMTSPLTPSLAKAARERVISFSQNNVLLGQGVFISPDGFAIAPGDVAFGPDGSPRLFLHAAFSGDKDVPVRVESFDAVTDIALIRIPLSPESFVKAAMPSSKMTSAVVLVALPSGSVRGHVARTSVTGVIGLSRRYVPLNEIRLESEQQGIPGSPVFLPDGRLVGMMLAALVTDASADAAPRSGAGFGGAMVKEIAPSAAKSIGPATPATAFSLDAVVLTRVISGFLSDSHQVTHPWVGLFFKTSVGGGALVTEVVDGGPAEKAGISVGDIVQTLGGQPVASQVDLASKLFSLGVGSDVQFGLVRNGVPTKTIVRIGTEAQAAGKLKRQSGRG